jgi:hypothetical protein
VASPADKSEISEFLARQLPYVRAFLQDGSVSYELQRALTSKPTFEAFFQAEEDYEELLKRHPAELKKYRQRAAKIASKLALFRLPPARRGRPRKDALAREAIDLKNAGRSYGQIAQILNLKHGTGTTTRAAVIQLIKRMSPTGPDKT